MAFGKAPSYYAFGRLKAVPFKDSHYVGTRNRK